MAIEPECHCRERTLSLGLGGRRFALRVELAAEDFEQFQVHYTALVARLADWHRKRGRGARQLEIAAVVHPWIAGRIKDYLNKLRDHGELAFLKRLPMHAVLVDEAGASVARWYWPPNQLKPEPAGLGG